MMHERVILGLHDPPTAACLPFLALSWVVVLLLPVNVLSAVAAAPRPHRMKPWPLPAIQACFPAPP